MVKKEHIKTVLSLLLTVVVLSAFFILIIVRQYVALWIFIAANLGFVAWVLYQRRKAYMTAVIAGSELLLKTFNPNFKRKKNKKEGDKK